MRFINQFDTILRYIAGVPKAGLPQQVYWVINEECNLKCRFCNFWKGIYREDGRRPLSTANIKSIIDKASRAGIPYLLFTGGEPFLRPDLPEILEYAAKRMPCVRVQTNGTLLTDAKLQAIVNRRSLDELWISVDGIGSTHDRFRGCEGIFEKVIGALKSIDLLKKKHSARLPYIVVHTVVNKECMEELPQILKICDDYNVNEWFLSYLTDVSESAVAATNGILKRDCVYSGQMQQGGDQATGDLRISDDMLKSIREARKKGLVVYIDPFLLDGYGRRPREKCLLLWSSMMVSPYGELLVCPMLDKCRMGNLLENEIPVIWNSKEFIEIRKKVISRDVPLCEECCVQRRTIWSQFKDPANFSRILIPRGVRQRLYRR